LNNLKFRLLILIACLLSSSGCSKGVLPPTGGGPIPLVAPGAPGTDVISTFTLVGHTEAGRRKWQVQGETADLMSETVLLCPVRATAFGQVEIHLSAQKGHFNKSTQNVHLEGDVVAVTSDDAELTTQSLNWVQESEQGSTEDWVRVTRPGMVAVGLGGIGQPKLKRVWLEKRVTVTLEDPKGKTVITCDGPMEVDYGRHKARFWKRVKVVDSTGVIRSDRLDVAFDSKSNRMEKAIFWGHVEIDRGDQVAHANRVNYWQPLGQIQLVGHPRMLLSSETLNE